MGGWISLIGHDSNFETRLKRFKRVFSVEGVPDLNIKVPIDLPEIKVIGWAWKGGNIPDVYVKQHNDIILILTGVITDLGRFSPSPSSLDKTVEIFLQLWIENGEKIIDQINGSFSCLFYNLSTKRALVYTDRFASRSVWYGKENEVFIIGNFPSAVAVMREKSPKLDPAGLWSLFHCGRQVETHCLYSGINTLMAGQRIMISSKNQVEVSQWWKRRYNPDNSLSARDWGYRITQALKNSASRHKKVAERPYLFLSGGLDSRIVAAAFKKPLNTLCLCSNPNAESRIAFLVAQILGLNHRRFIRSPYWYFDTMDASALISSGIYLTHHAHFMVPVRTISSEVIDAEFLLGDLLENFNKHYFSLPENQNLHFSSNNIENILYSLAPYTIRDVNHFGIHFNKKLRESIQAKYIGTLQKHAQSLLEVSEDYADVFDTFLRWCNVGITPTYNMITSIWPLAKERNLYFDNEIDDLSLKVPSYLRRAGLLHKWIIYYLAKMLTLVIDANTFMPPFFSKNLGDYAKKIRPYIGKLRRRLIHIRQSIVDGQSDALVLKTSGSWLFTHEMYRKDERYKKQIEDIIYDKIVFPPDLFDLEQIKKTWEEYLAGNMSLHFEVEVLRSFGSLQRHIPCNEIDI